MIRPGLASHYANVPSMRFWFINSWSYVCFVGLMLIVLALQGPMPKTRLPDIALRAASAICGLAIIIFGIWMNLR